MSIMSDFETYKNNLNDKVANICQGKLLDATYQEIFDQAQTVVYDAHSTDGFRRRSLLDRNNYKDKYYRSGDIHTIEVETNLSFQGTPWSPDLAIVISNGLTNFHQPGPRPWMREAEKAMEEKAQGILEAELAGGVS